MGREKEGQQTNDLTEGNIVKTVILFSLPFLLANFIQALYGAVDLLVIGWYDSPEAVAAVSVGTQVTQIMISIISGLTLGSTVLVGRYVGMKQLEEIKKTISTSICLFGGVGVFLTVVMFFLSKKILVLLQTPKAAFGLATEYVCVCALGSVFICGYNAISAILRGYGDSRTPLIFVAVAGILNVIGDIVLVKYFHMGVKGTALATIFSQGFSMFSAAVYLNRQNFIFEFRRGNFHLYTDKVRELLKVGVPISLQECMVRISFLYLSAVVNTLGINAASAVGIAGKYDVFAMLPASSAASALASIVAQNHGAKKYKRMNQALWVGILSALPFSAVFFLWAQISPESMIGVFSQNAAIIAEGIPFFRTCSFDYIFVVFVFSMNGYLNGRGKTVFTMMSSCFAALALRMPLIYLACHLLPDNLAVIGTVAPFVSAIMALYTLFYTIYLSRKPETV